MRKLNQGKRLLAAWLIVSMLVALFPLGGVQVAYAAEDFEVKFGKGVTIGNATYAAQNAFINFYQNDVPGFTHPIKPSQIIDWSSGNIRLGYGDNWETAKFVINVANNPELKALAQSGEAEVLIGFSKMIYYSGFLSWTRITRGSIKVDNDVLFSRQTPKGGIGRTEVKAKITPTSVITIEFTGEGRRYKDNGRLNGVEGFYVKFQDTKRPVLEDYDLNNGVGAQRTNVTGKQHEMYIKQQEELTLTYKFSEPVRPSALSPNGQNDHFLRHPLFVNIAGTGLPAAGEQQYMNNLDFLTNADVAKYAKDIRWRYTGSRYHQSAGYVTPKITGGTTGSQMDQSMEEKLKGAKLADAAGNVVQLRMPRKTVSPILEERDEANNLISFINGTTDDPFNPRNGFAVIIDGVAPKYTKVGNGIQPEILTGVNINKNDTIDFTVQLTEDAVVKRGWDVNRTFIHLNNGMKAYYVAGQNTKNWTFRATIPDGTTVETPLLKVIAISHDQKGNDSDINVIQDYAGNLLIQPADFTGEHVDGTRDHGDVSLVQSKIDWAKLIIDNTPPDIDFRYQNGGANDQQYLKNGNITVDANDPNLLIPHLDPVQSDRGSERPSMGIFRPSNMTGGSSPSVGLIFYWWSQTSTNPLDGKEDDQYAAIKRYSISGKQPSEELYEGFDHLQLQVVSNKNNLIAPPPEAIAAGTAGPWYLHAWTADMTWDSARELKQYEKMKEYKRLNHEQYEQWKAELQGSDVSDADREFYADNKALVAVGDYGDTNVWPLEDFKQEDSNWSYSKTTMLLDNAVPEILSTGIAGDNTMNVEMTVSVTDEHSGLAQADYQWVKAGAQPSDVDWKQVDLQNGQATLRTLGEVIEDGDYHLFIKASDNAGNATVWQAEDTVHVSSLESVSGEFLTEANTNYVKSADVHFRISGVTPDLVGYAVTSSAVRPSGDSSYTTLQPLADGARMAAPSGEALQAPDASGQPPEDSPSTETKQEAPEVSIQSAGTAEETPDGESSQAVEGGAEEEPAVDTVPDDQASEPLMTPLSLPTSASYAVPVSAELNGIYYVHMMVKQGDRYYYFSKAYYLDNSAPQITFNKKGVDYPREKQDVTVTVTENYSKNNMDNKYLWVLASAAAPERTTAGWQQLPASGVAVIDNAAVEAGKVADYKLYVWATDGAGNDVIAATESTFKVSKPAGPENPPVPGASDIIYVSGDAQDGYTAILKLDLTVQDKHGYEYSVSPDNGDTWERWKPYTNFVSLKVPTNLPEQLKVQVKYRGPSGVVGPAKDLAIDKVAKEEPVYGLATLSTTRPVKGETGVNIDVTLPLGLRVVPAAVNPSTPVRSGNTFKVQENGYYAFDVMDLSDNTRKDVLYIVVSSIDNEAPRATIEYNITGPTNANVTARISDSSEPIVMVNNNGRNAYTFEENGSFLFQFRDEAGNVGTELATVANINRETPKVRIVRSYHYGANGSLSFGTITDGNGTVLFSSGVTLEVQPEVSGQKLLFPDMKNVQTLFDNGIARFVVADENGNTTVVEEDVSTILSDAPEPTEVTYSFVDNEGVPLPEEQIVTIGGERYARGKVKVTLSGSVTAPNQVFSGLSPIQDDNGQYTNRISEQDGSYTYSRTFSSNGSTSVGFSDLLGNNSRVPVTIRGLDNVAPEITLNKTSVGILKGTKDVDYRTALGGYTVSDNLSAAADLKVEVVGLDTEVLGERTVIYKVTDQVGNTTEARQKVIVMAEGGMLIFGNDTLISAAFGETALFNTNVITFRVTGFNEMTVGGQKAINEWGTFDLLYQPGLYREGQMKYIAQKVSYKELVSGQFKITFPKVGWYTIIVRNQEREREYATFFVGKLQ
ncbi:hypothetical protein PA598K_02885 [Paenibacillus sp. 598K]|uniref:hypothetical protein n=1 Tax=Paenibacillus sp. 598K TaxID=1117987 RepID=UPI000FFA9723|nr:hypothetical protein [Paenibacillus sp. 598K]GBF74535.1 hypothetical protein PA598K_02885 [Paenibacillus sp. 598K]